LCPNNWGHYSSQLFKILSHRAAKLSEQPCEFE
jgi:hypothetical protein